MRQFIVGAIAALAMCGQLHAQSAPGWPSRPVKMVVPFTAGSFTDVAARALAKELATQLRQPFVVDNRVGAGGTIGVDAVAKAAPDGYTLLFGENSFAIVPSLYGSLPYDSAKDIVQIAQLAEVPAVLVASKSFAAADLKALVQLARTRPGAINFGSAGQGTSAHLAMEALGLQAGITMTHIPYKGISAAIPELIAGHIDIAIASIGTMSAYIREARVRGLALSGSARHKQFPQIPTFAEQGYPDYSFMYWFGLMAPAGTPKDVRDKLQAAVIQAARQPELIKVLEAASVQPKPTTAQEFSRRVRDEMTLWASVIREAKVKPE